MSTSMKWIVVVLISAAAVFFFIKSKKKSGGAEKVTVEKAAKRTIIETVSASGKIFPETEIRVSAEFSGQVSALKVAEGDTVKKGQVLAVINNRTNLESAIDGVVLSLKVKKGEIITGNSFSIGTEIMTIADMSVLEVRADVGETDIVKLSVGDSAEITVDAYSNRYFRGVVTRIANSTRQTGPAIPSAGDITNYEVKIRLDPSSYSDFKGKPFAFRPGMNAGVELKTKKAEQVISVPISAVNARVKDSDLSMDEKRKKESKEKEEEILSDDNTGDDLEEVVFILQKDGTVKKTVVKTGIQDISYIEIQGGLNEGAEVVTGPYTALSKSLKNGMKVKVVSKEKLFEQ